MRRRRNERAARPFFRRLLEGLHHVSRVAITAELAGYGTAKREVSPSVAHRVRLSRDAPAAVSEAGM